MKEPKSSYPTPLLQVMNDDKPTFSYLLIYIYIFFSFILCIYSFLFWITFFSTKEEYQKELFYLEYLGLVPINLCLSFIWMKFGLLLYREVRKKCFPSESWVSHLWGTRHTSLTSGMREGINYGGPCANFCLKDNIRSNLYRKIGERKLKRS